MENIITSYFSEKDLNNLKKIVERKTIIQTQNWIEFEKFFWEIRDEWQFAQVKLNNQDYLFGNCNDEYMLRVINEGDNNQFEDLFEGLNHYEIFEKTKEMFDDTSTSS